ncbi:hypothetical protein ACFQ15_07325 [Sphingomonas hankookensis]|nr:hypothetical protein [Sphingomonas hankookensis]
MVLYYSAAALIWALSMPPIARWVRSQVDGVSDVAPGGRSR